MKTIIKTLIAFLITQTLFAATGGLLKISPLYGLERIQKLSPEVKTKTRTFIGVRAVFGITALSAEAEVTRSEDSESIFARDLKEDEESYAAKLGLRSGFGLGPLSWYLRAGGQARKSTYTTTIAGVTTTREPAIRISPYAGTGFRVNLANMFFADGGVTAVFTGKPKGSDYELQGSLAFGIRI